MRFSVNAVIFRPAKKGAPSCVGTIPCGRACLADGLCLSLGRGIGGMGLGGLSCSCPALQGGDMVEITHLKGFSPLSNGFIFRGLMGLGACFVPFSLASVLSFDAQKKVPKKRAILPATPATCSHCAVFDRFGCVFR